MTRSIYVAKPAEGNKAWRWTLTQIASGLTRKKAGEIAQQVRLGVYGRGLHAFCYDSFGKYLYTVAWRG